jgi:hypothetical protein
MANGETMSEPNKEQWNHAKALWGAACGGMPEGINEARIRAMAEAIAARDADQLDALTAERDALQKHYDAAGPEHNLLALLDHYHERMMAMKAERDAARKQLDTAQNLILDLHEENDPEGEVAKLRAELSLCHDRVTELKTALDSQRESYGGAANDAFDAIAELCGCEQWDYPGQLVRDVQALREKLTTAEAERDAEHAKVVWFVEQAADVRLDGYRELGQRAANAENSRDEARRGGEAALGAIATLRAELDAARDANAGCVRQYKETFNALVRAEAERDDALRIALEVDDRLKALVADGGGRLDALISAVALVRDECERRSIQHKGFLRVAERLTAAIEPPPASPEADERIVDGLMRAPGAGMKRRSSSASRSSSITTRRTALASAATAPVVYFTRWRCPVCGKVSMTEPLFKLDCRDGHDWAAMLPEADSQAKPPPASPSAFEPFKTPQAQRCDHGKLPGEGCAYCLAYPKDPDVALCTCPEEHETHLVGCPLNCGHPDCSSCDHPGAGR